jgi:hypothetical protein
MTELNPLPTAEHFIGVLRGFFDTKQALSLDEHLDGEEGLWKLPGGVIYLKSDLDLDTDGPKAKGIQYERTHQDVTALRWKDGSSIDSNSVPYVVIPGHWNRGIDLGCACLVQFGDRVVLAQVGDIGPRLKIGEGSIALHRQLGFERVKNGKIVDSAIDSGVRTIFFPGTATGYCHGQMVLEMLLNMEWAKLEHDLNLSEEA